ncbi:hypothetical protein AB6A40_011670 [Gnathostoma spinigerum]|uniref:UBA domain-containing protein n=1 Tax=Gnathostoma spinigerum TaxID=75299 RepID=A0ABD6EZR2_9BILA
MNEYGPLDDEQMDKLRQFQEVTNCQDTDMAIAKLASLEWDVNRAIDLQLNDEEMDTNNPSAEVIETTSTEQYAFDFSTHYFVSSPN